MMDVAERQPERRRSTLLRPFDISKFTGNGPCRDQPVIAGAECPYLEFDLDPALQRDETVISRRDGDGKLSAGLLRAGIPPAEFGMPIDIEIRSRKWRG